jgi:predicted nucleic acid-binding protein
MILHPITEIRGRQFPMRYSCKCTILNLQELRYKQVPGWFTQARINILPVTYREIHNSKQFRDTYGLLTDDSIILAVMSRYKIADLATNDRDFRRVPGIRLWTPTS